MAVSHNAGTPPTFRPQPPLPPTPQEVNDIQLLVDMLGTTSSEEDILRLLRSNNGDMDKTASALLEGSAAAVLNGPSNTGEQVNGCACKLHLIYSPPKNP